MIEIALYQPEIPPNTGNIIRLCANTGASLHLIHPLGFSPDEKQVRRAGLDYHEWTSVIHHDNYACFQDATAGKRLIAFTTKSNNRYSDFKFHENDILLFGPETRGLPEDVRHEIGEDFCLTIPMKEHSRSLNLSNSVAVALYEGWRQCGFR